MATLTTLVDGTVAVVAPVNANFAALNAQVSTGSADQVYRIPHAGGDGAFGNLHSSTLFSLGTGTSTGRLVALAFADATSASSVGAAETDLHSWTAAASTFAGTNGDGLLIRAEGLFAANANTKTLKLKIGNSTAMKLNLTTAAPNNKVFSLDLHCSISSSNAIDVYGVMFLAAAGAVGTSGSSPILEAAGYLGALVVTDTHTSQVVKFTGTGTANGDVSLLNTHIFVFRNPV